MLDKTFSFLLGLILSILFLVAGFILSNWIEHVIGILLSVCAIPGIGYLFYKSAYRFIGLGMLISLVPISILGLLFFVVSSLH